MRAITDRKNRSDDVRHRRVLIVDDDRDFADALAELLEFEDYLVETVYGADQIEAASRRFAPDVALIDIMLGDASGLDQQRRYSLEQGVPFAILILAGSLAELRHERGQLCSASSQERLQFGG